jgi:hypothetical protein
MHAPNAIDMRRDISFGGPRPGSGIALESVAGLAHSSATGPTAAVLREVLRSRVGIAIWQRELTPAVCEATAALYALLPQHRLFTLAADADAAPSLDRALVGFGSLPASSAKAWRDDLLHLIALARGLAQGAGLAGAHRDQGERCLPSVPRRQRATPIDLHLSRSGHALAGGWRIRPVPVTLLTSALGSGKTTLLNRILAEQLHLDAIVTLVDAYHIEAQLEQPLKAHEQIAFADVILLNKTDLIDAAQTDRIEQRVRAMNGQAGKSP